MKRSLLFKATVAYGVQWKARAGPDRFWEATTPLLEVRPSALRQGFPGTLLLLYLLSTPLINRLILL